LTLARHDDSRKCLLLLEAILDTPGLADRLLSGAAARTCHQQSAEQAMSA
jgi:hypothetical protein